MTGRHTIKVYRTVILLVGGCWMLRLLFFERKRKGIKNDPAAGSPTATLLRLHLPLSFKIWETSLENIRQSRQDPRSEYLTGKLNR